MTRNKLRYLIALGTGLLLCTGRGAQAQSAQDRAAADALFDEGRKLINKPNDRAAWAAACEKFEASVAKFLQLGAQFAVAGCYEKIGKTASAWGAFRKAAASAARLHDARQRLAEQHASALEAKLSKIAVRIEAAGRVAGLEIKRDGSVVALAEIGTPIPVDPGEHTVEASAKGRVPWFTTVRVGEIAEVFNVSVPALQEIVDPGATRRTRRLIAYGTGGAGIIALDVSLILGAVAAAKWHDSELHCVNHGCDPTGVKLANRASTLATASTVTFVAGAAAVAAGVVILLTSRSSTTESSQPAAATALHLLPGIGSAPLGLTIQRGF